MTMVRNQLHLECGNQMLVSALSPSKASKRMRPGLVVNTIGRTFETTRNHNVIFKFLLRLTPQLSVCLKIPMALTTFIARQPFLFGGTVCDVDLDSTQQM